MGFGPFVEGGFGGLAELAAVLGERPGDAAVLAVADEAVGFGAGDFRAPRLLAECEAKRRIMEIHALEPSDDADRRPGCGNCIAAFSWGTEVVGGPCGTLLALAAVYADYRDEWRA